MLFHLNLVVKLNYSYKIWYGFNVINKKSLNFRWGILGLQKNHWTRNQIRSDINTTLSYGFVKEFWLIYNSAGKFSKFFFIIAYILASHFALHNLNHTQTTGCREKNNVTAIILIALVNTILYLSAVFLLTHIHTHTQRKIACIYFLFFIALL